MTAARILALSALAATASAQPIRVLTLDATRVSSCSGRSFHFGGPYFDAIRAAITDPSNFGPTGVVPRPLSLASVPVLDVATLGGADVVLLTQVGPRLTAEEEMALNSFVLAGGGLIWFENSAAQRVADMVGAVPGGFHASAPALVGSSASPLVTGPFGSVAAGQSVPHGYCGSFADVGPLGATVVTVGSETFAAEFALGAGRIAAFTDEEILVSTPVSGCASALLGSSSRTMLLNALAWVAPAGGFSFGSSQNHLAALGPPCANGAALAPNLAALGENYAGGTLRFRVTDGAPSAPAGLFFGGVADPPPVVLGCPVYVAPVVVLPLATDAQGEIRVSVSLPAGITGLALGAQVFLLDLTATTAITATHGVRVSFN